MVDLELTNQPFMLCNWGKYLHNMIPKKKKENIKNNNRVIAKGADEIITLEF